MTMALPALMLPDSWVTMLPHGADDHTMAKLRAAAAAVELKRRALCREAREKRPEDDSEEEHALLVRLASLAVELRTARLGHRWQRSTRRACRRSRACRRHRGEHSERRRRRRV